MYRDLFGAEDAWNIYKIVKVPTYKKEQEKSLRLNKKANCKFKLEGLKHSADKVM